MDLNRLLYCLQSFLICILVVSFSLPSFADSQSNAFSKEGRYDLHVLVEKDKRARVIVGFAIPILPGGLRPQVARQLRQEAHDKSLKIFLDRITGPNAKEIMHFRELPFTVLEVDAQGIGRLLTDPDVISVEEDRRLELHLFDTPGIIRANLAWAAGYRGEGQTVAILDTGVDTSHPFFVGKVADEACFSTPGSGFVSLCPNGQPTQFGPGAGTFCPDLNLGCYHGTHVAGIALGQEGVLNGTSGIAPLARLMPVLVFSEICDYSGCAISASTSDLVSAMEWVYSQQGTFNIAAVNMSLGSGAYTSTCDNISPAMKSAIDQLRSVNIATVVSSGNGGLTNSVSFPACISTAVSVGATTKQNEVATFSNAASFMSLLAPGQYIYSAYPGGSFISLSGTSMAAPHVAGAWALLKSARPTSTVQEVLDALQTTGLPITDPRQGLVKPLIQIGNTPTSEGALGKLLSLPGANLNQALAANGGVASASSVHSSGYPVAAVNDGNQSGAGWGSGGGWNDATRNVYPDWVEIDFNGPKAITEIDVFTLQDNYNNPVAPTETMKFSLYGITAFNVQYWNGAAWVTVPGGGVTGNTNVWRRFSFSSITTRKIRVLVNASLAGYSRIVEIEAWGTNTVADQPPTVNLSAPTPGATFTAPADITLSASASDPDGTVAKVEFFQGTVKLGEVLTAPYTLLWPSVPAGSYTLTAVATDNLGVSMISSPVMITVASSGSINYALAANGGVARASSTYNAGYPVSAVNDGERSGVKWAHGGGWNDATRNAYPDWIEIDFSGPKVISQIDLFTLQDNYVKPLAPTQLMTFSLYGITAFEVQDWTGSAWETVPGGSVSGNSNVWRHFQFSPITTQKIRVLVNASLAGYSRIVEIEAR